MPEHFRGGLGFKIPSVDSILDPDLISDALISDDDGTQDKLTPAYILHAIESIQLDAAVPLEVRRSFQMALGAMIYGYWYYPLYTLVSQQILRVGDFALDYFARTVGVAKPLPISARIRELYDAGLLSLEDRDHWEAIRRLRNSVAHPASTQIWPLSHAIDVAQLVAGAIAVLPWDARQTALDESETVIDASRTSLQSGEVGSPTSARGTSASMRDRVFIERRPQGDYAVRRGNAKRASAIARTQREAIQLARNLTPAGETFIERVRGTVNKSPDKWRKP